MKKRRISRKANATKEKIKAADVRYEEEVQCSGCSFADLPRNLLVTVLLKLSIKRVVICKCVCKSWHNVISDSAFANLHFGQAETYPLIRTSNYTRVSRILYLLQSEKSQDFNPEFGCDCDHEGGNWKCHHQVNMELETKLKLPLRNMESVFNDEEGKNCNSKGIATGKHCIKVRPKDQKYKIVNSCNGLLCLSEPTRNVPVVVCNPVTSEFINLPETQISDHPHFRATYVDCGLGFSPESKQYKVIRMINHFNPKDSGEGFWNGRVAEVLTLGTGSWKNIGSAPNSLFKIVCRPTYLNGALHWFHGSTYLDSIVSFDVENERLQSLSPPVERLRLLNSFNECDLSMGVLGGCLCITDAYNNRKIDVWVMKVYGVGSSWTKMYSIDTFTIRGWPRGLYQPIKEMKNGALLFFQYPKSALIYYHPDELGFKYYTVRGVLSQFEAIAHTSSFIPLKDALQGDGMHVLNVYSRCGEVKVPGEARTFYLVEQEKNFSI